MNRYRNQRETFCDVWTTWLTATLGWRHRVTCGKSVPLRVLVTGTEQRGRVARLIAAGLRAGGCPAPVRTCGEFARYISSAGLESPLPRWARGRLTSQAWALRQAIDEAAEAIVVASLGASFAARERRLLKPTLTVHVGSDDGRLRSSAGSIVITDDAVAEVSWDELAQFAYVESPENVALALLVCRQLGVPREAALEGMTRAPHGPGLTTILRLPAWQPDPSTQAIRRPIFVNGFATFRGETTRRIWQLAIECYGRGRRPIAVVNCRADHQQRAQELGELCGAFQLVDHYVLVGDATDQFRERALAAGLSESRMTCLPNASPAKIAQVVRRTGGPSVLLLGLGSFSGLGSQLVEHYRQLQAIAPAWSVAEPAQPPELTPRRAA